MNADKLIRYALFAVVAVLVFSLLSEWNRYSAEYDAEMQRKVAAQRDIQPALTIPGADEETTVDAAADEELPIIESSTGAVVTTSSEPSEMSLGGNNASRQVVVENNTLRVTIDKLGGNIVEVQLLKHLETLENDSPPLRLLEKNTLRNYTAQSGLIGKSGSDVKSARALFSSEKDFYISNDGAVSAELVFTDSSGVSMRKTFSLQPDSYLVDVDYHIDNRSKQNWSGNFYAQISRDSTEDPGADTSSFGMRSYLGTATSTEESPYLKISFKDIEKENYRHSREGGWVAMIQHYFVSAWIPESGKQHYFTKKTRSGQNIIGFYSDRLDIAAGDSGEVGAEFYAGPKNQYKLAEHAEHLDLTVDYGWLWWLAQPLYALLYFFSTGELHIFGKVYPLFSGFHNWGVAIILLTIFVKAVFFKLSAASYRSMANMRRVQPKLLAIRERYGNDKQAQSKAMMELYQKEKINPLGGCLPILIQMPVFIALYWALMESVELRHSSFLWMEDLSVMDPYFILPIVMGATMWFQQKMNPAPPDPMQAKVMAWMPIIFTFFFLWFPAGLVVYWVSNNILSIAQQWVITRSIEKEGSN